MRRAGFKTGIQLLIIAALLGLATQPALAATFVNPLGNTTSFSGLLVKITQFLLGLAGFFAMLSLVWGGVLYIISLGKDDYIQQAKKIITWAIIGLIVIILSYVIIQTVSRFLGIAV